MIKYVDKPLYKITLINCVFTNPKVSKKEKFFIFASDIDELMNVAKKLKPTWGDTFDIHKIKHIGNFVYYDSISSENLICMDDKVSELLYNSKIQFRAIVIEHYKKQNRDDVYELIFDLRHGGINEIRNIGKGTIGQLKRLIENKYEIIF
jgi:hypothetical protein